MNGQISRKELLHRLLCVEPGLSRRESVQQSTCIVLRRGRFYTMSQEIACSAPSLLPKDFEGAVRADRLMDIVKTLPDDDIDVAVEAKTLFLKAGKSRRTKIVMEEEVVLPVDDVDKPGEWMVLSQDFTEAVDVVHRVCKKPKQGEDSSFLKECVHFHPKYLEACDDRQFCRFPTAAPVSEPVLVRGTSLGVIRQLGMTKGCCTDGWLHFRNPSAKQSQKEQSEPVFLQRMRK